MCFCFFLFMDAIKHVKGNAQFICNLEKSSASRVCIDFLQITQKIRTKNIFHWLELITEILSFLEIFSVRKTTTQLFNISETLPEYQEKTIFLAHFEPLKANYRKFTLLLILHCFFLALITVFSYV